MPLSFSVVINTYNRARYLARALDALAYLRHPRFEVIVVNGPSEDDTDAVLARHAGGVRVGRCPERNLSASRNVGIAMAHGEVVCFLDDDAVAEPDWLTELEPGYREPRVGAVGGFIRDHTGVAFQSKVVVCDRFGESRSFESVEEAGLVEAAFPDRYLTLTGTNSSFRRTALLEIGGFDEEYAYFLDETDVILRLTQAGWAVRYCPAAEIHHKYAESHLRTATKVPKSLYHVVRSTAYFCVRHAPPGRPLEPVVAHLAQRRRALERDTTWLRDGGYLDVASCARLLEEIERGMADGVRDAFARAPVRGPLPSSNGVGFHAFPVRRPVARRLRVCLLSQDYPPGKCGGIGVWTHTLATALAAEGHEVSVVTRGAGHPTVDFEDGVWVHRIVVLHDPDRCVPALPDLPQGIRDYAYAAHDEVLRIAARRGLDVVSSPIWDLEGVACLAARIVPNVLSLHSTFKLVLPSKPEWQQDDVYRRLHVDKMIAGEGWALAQADLVLANSGAIVTDIEAAYGLTLDRLKLALVPHGMPAPVVAASGAPRHGGVQLLYVGRFELRKGIDLLLDVLPALLEELPELEAVLVGETDIPVSGVRLKDTFLAQYAGREFLQRVTFTGTLPEAELEAAYAACDLFVAPSRYESFGLVYLEAMRFGKPCIGVDVGGIPEVVHHGVDGLLVPPGDARALGDAIRLLVRDADTRRRLGAAAADTFCRRFSAERMAAETVAVYGALLRTSHPARGAEDAGRERSETMPTGIYMGNNRVLTETKHGVRLYLDTRDIVITPIVLLRGEWEAETLAVLTRLLRPGMRFVDVGANVGYFTCHAARFLMPGGKIWAFEADPGLFELLTDNVALNWYWDGVTLEQKAVYSRDVRVTLYQRSKYKGNTSIGRSATSDLARIFDDETACEVEAVTLDGYFLPQDERIDLLKIDVEGAEPHVLEGMRGLVARQPAMQIMLEWSPGQILKAGGDPAAVIAFLKEHRFRCQLLEHGARVVEPDELTTVSLSMMLLVR